MPTPTPTRRAALAASLLLTCAASGAAHDFWIEPSAPRAAPGALLEIRLRVGEHFVGDLVARNEKRIVRFVARDAALTERAVLGIDGESPAGLLRLERPGLHVLGYQSHATAIELEAAKFEQYLAEEGLERVIEERRARGESARSGREAYARCAKALLVAQGEQELAPADWKGFDVPLGLALELVPLANPCSPAPGAELDLRLVWQGKPLAGALVGCLAQADPQHELRVRSDEEGRVRFKLARGGAQLVHAVHMVRAAPGADRDWESHWASLTFEARAR
jgi:hypothetical protein